MKTLWKVLLGAVVAAPASSYVLGSLASSSADEPSPRPTIVIRVPASGGAPQPTPSGRPTGAPDDAASAGVGHVQVEPDVLADDHDDWGRDHPGHGSDDTGADDHGGSGSGESGSGGSGSGGSDDGSGGGGDG